MNILQVSKTDVLGGAERIAMQLFKGYQQSGHNAFLAVGERLGEDSARNILELPAFTFSARRRADLRRWLDRLLPRAERSWRVQLLCNYLTNPGAFGRAIMGRDSFAYPGTWKLSQLAPSPPDVIHCHNLHGSYFDLRALAMFARQAPVVVTMHDAWMLTGGCVHPLECTRYLTGCGNCPHRDLYFRASLIDSTAVNWRRKKKALRGARLHVVTPAKWLMDQIKGSILESAIASCRVISNGVDLTVFQPRGVAARRAARESLGLDLDAHVVMHASATPQRNASKDYPTMRAAVEAVARDATKKVIFLVVGEAATREVIAGGEVRFIPFLKSEAAMAACYAAADVYVQGSVSDTFPNTVLEAMACGLPVVGTAVGGMPEQIVDGQTGYIVPAKNVRSMIEALRMLRVNETVRQMMGKAALDRVAAHFDLQQQLRAYLAYYEEIIRDYRKCE